MALVEKISKIFYSFKIKIYLWKKAFQDYKRARGTQHLNLLKHLKPKIEKDFQIKLKELKNLYLKLKSIEEREKFELERKATEFIVESLDQVNGIGPKLKERILKHSFFGDLEDLKMAIFRVRGIGREKQIAINRWIEQQKSFLKELVERGMFPGREEVTEKYLAEKRILNEKIKKIEIEKEKISTLYYRLLQEINWLSKIKPTDFYKSYFSKTSMDLNKYLIGVFPEWKKIPRWLKELISRYGK